MTVRWLTAFLDRPGPTFEAATRFWLQVTASDLSSARGEHDQFATLIPPDGDAYLRVQRIVDGAGGCHLDLHVDDISATATRAVELGASRVQTFDDVTVLRSPTGLRFCAVRHLGESTRPRPPTVTVPAARTLVDQLCVDIRPDGFEQECTFWAALTGWERRSPLLSGFSYLFRPDGIPLRLLFQRLDDADGPTTNAHLDLASYDRDAAADWHQELGAVLVRRHEYWTTLADPSGLPYCITRRNPDTGVLDSPA
jgi:hypothetical protein